MINTLSKPYFFFFDVFLKRGDIYAIGPYYSKIHFPNHNPYITGDGIKIYGEFLPDKDCHTLLFKFTVPTGVNVTNVPLTLSYCHMVFNINIENELSVKKHRLSMSTTIKNEEDNLHEWIEHHLRIGFEHFYLYDNNTGDQDALHRILDPYIEKDIVTLIDWSFPFKYYIPERFPVPLDSVYFCQIVALNHCIHKYGQETEWLMNMDPDEYLVPKIHNTVTRVLNKFQDQRIGGLYIHDYVFGPNDNTNTYSTVNRFYKRSYTYTRWLCGGKVISRPEHVIFGELHVITKGEKLIIIPPYVMSINHYHFNKNGKDCSDRFDNTKYPVVDLRAINLSTLESKNVVSMNDFGTWARLGNQMFQYAFLRVLSIKNNLRIELPKLQSPFGNTQSHLFDAFDLPIKIRTSEQEWQENIIENSLAYDESYLSRPNDVNVLVSGYFQTDKYFKDYADVIRQDFTFKKPVVETGDKYLENMCQNIPLVAMHVRRGDNLSKNSPTALVTDTFRIRALGYLDAHVGKYSVLVFSDDKKWTKENLPPSYTFVSGLSDIEELYVMTKCNHFIIGSSSYSWWGAWLSRCIDKIVICPDRWFTNKILYNKPLSSQGHDIYPKDWVILPMDREEKTGKMENDKPEWILFIEKQGIVYNEKTNKIELPHNVKQVKIDVGLSYHAPFSKLWLEILEDRFVFGFEPNQRSIESILTGHYKDDNEFPNRLRVDPDEIGKNFALIPCAVDLDDKVSTFYDTVNDVGCSSLYKPTSSAWIGGCYDVTCLRLSTFLHYFPWDRFPYIEHIKIDAQGNDLRVIKSIGKYLDRFVYITAEVGYENVQYVCDKDMSGHSLKDIDDYLLTRGYKRVPTKIYSNDIRDIRVVNVYNLSTNNPTYVNTKFGKDILKNLSNSCL